MKQILMALIFISSSVLAAPVALPLGGSLSLSSDWVVSPNSVAGGKSLVIASASEKRLTGLILDGTIKTASQCLKQSAKKWGVCQEQYKKGELLYYQIVLERRLDLATFQKYVISFNFPQSQLPRFSGNLKKLENELEQQ